MPTVFITGIEGFVGTHLAKLLREQDKDVSGLYWNEPAPDLRHCQIERCDIRDVARLRSLLGRVRPAFIVHLAAISSVAVAERDMLEAIEINAGGTWSLLSSVQREAPRARVLLISSGEVYDQTPSEASTLH
ncbi:MAG: NAD-dependent epimerase/dehydratase family protein, partial [candidate division WOR-3 bacterium]